MELIIFTHFHPRVIENQTVIVKGDPNVDELGKRQRVIHIKGVELFLPSLPAALQRTEAQWYNSRRRQVVIMLGLAPSVP